MIRDARPDDLDAIVAMGERFIAETAYCGRIASNPAQMRETAGLLIASEVGALFVAERDGVLTGMIGLLRFTHPLSGEPFVSELFWWVNPEHRGGGVRLLKRAELWAQQMGATALQMIAPDRGVAAIYKALGYEEVETLFQRTVTR